MSTHNSSPDTVTGIGRGFHWLSLFFLVFAVTVILDPVQAKENVFPELTLDGNELPDVWEAPRNRPWERRNFKVMSQDGRTFIRATKPVAFIHTEKPIQPEWKILRLSLDVRIRDLVKGVNAWDVPGAGLDFLDKDGKSLLTWEKTNWFSKDTEWKTFTRDYPVPEGAKTVHVNVYYKAKSGTADFANIKVLLAEQRQGAAIDAILKEREAAEKAAAAKRKAEIQAYLDWEAKRLETERKPINGWVRPPVKPVKMTKPLEPPPVTGNTYYVAKNGNNATGDGTIEKPWKTVQHGMNQLHPGDCLHIREGTYEEGMLTFARSGRADAYITVAGYPDETAIIAGTGLAVFNFSAGSQWTPKRLHEEAYLVVRDLSVNARDCNQAFRTHGPMMLEEYSKKPLLARRYRHNIWICNNEVYGGNGNESLMGAGYGAHHIVISNNRIHDVNGLNSYRYSDGTIVEWNTMYNSSRNSDDAGAIKSMAPGVIIRYNTLNDNYRSSTSKSPGWAPRSRGGKQWRFLQGATGIYLDWAMFDERKPYPNVMKPKDPANYIYGNTVHGSNAGIYVFKADHAQVFDNIVSGSGRNSSGGWVEGKKDGKWLEYVGPAGYGIAVTKSIDVKVFNNISFNNEKAGLATQEAPGCQVYNNIVFQNDLAQFHVRKGEEGAFGFNTILKAGKQGPPFRRLKKDYPDIAAYREEFPYSDIGTKAVDVSSGKKPLAFAKELLATNGFSEDKWKEAHQELLAKAREAGVGRPSKTVPQAPYDPSGGLQKPMPWDLPGVVEFENYDVGGPGVSYEDSDMTNQGGHYRKDYVDVKKSAKGSNGAVVGYTTGNEWLEYTVDVAKGGNRAFVITYATAMADRKVRLELDGKTIGEVTFPMTSSWDDLKTVKLKSRPLKQGSGVLRVVVVNGPVDLDRFDVK